MPFSALDIGEVPASRGGGPRGTGQNAGVGSRSQGRDSCQGWLGHLALFPGLRAGPGPLPWCLRHIQPLWPLSCLETLSGFWHNFSLTLLGGPASHPHCQTCSQESTVPPGLFAVPTHHSCRAGDLLSLANPVYLWLPHTSNL